MTKETENLYKPLLDYDLAKEENTRANELKRALVLFETDDWRIVTWDEFTGKKAIEEEPAETVAEQPAEPEIENPAFYPMYKGINNIEEKKDNQSEYTQVIVKFIDSKEQDEATA